MREIKFRAWDKWNEAMVYPKGILFDGRIVEFSCGSLDAWEGYEIMQYTGLKDRNGREIYEGDIIQDDDGFFWRVYFEDGKFRARGGEYEEVDDLNEFCPYWCAVIGNIYENPELLKQAEELEGE